MIALRIWEIINNEENGCTTRETIINGRNRDSRNDGVRITSYAKIRNILLELIETYLVTNARVLVNQRLLEWIS